MQKNTRNIEYHSTVNLVRYARLCGRRSLFRTVFHNQYASTLIHNERLLSAVFPPQLSQLLPHSPCRLADSVGGKTVDHQVSKPGSSLVAISRYLQYLAQLWGNINSVQGALHPPQTGGPKTWGTIVVQHRVGSTTKTAGHPLMVMISYSQSERISSNQRWHPRSPSRQQKRKNRQPPPRRQR